MCMVLVEEVRCYVKGGYVYSMEKYIVKEKSGGSFKYTLLYIYLLPCIALFIL